MKKSEDLLSSSLVYISEIPWVFFYQTTHISPLQSEVLHPIATSPIAQTEGGDGQEAGKQDQHRGDQEQWQHHHLQRAQSLIKARCSSAKIHIYYNSRVRMAVALKL